VGERADPQVLRANAHAAVGALAPLAREHGMVIVHGNGPREARPELEAAADPLLECPYPMDVLGARAQGMFGYWLLEGLQNALPGRAVVAVVNQTLVSASDPAFAAPNAFVGPEFGEQTARALAAERGWVMAPDGAYWRRVVPAPRPQRVIESRIIRLLLASGAVVVCAGGGGVPVVRDEAGRLVGVAAVVDNDLTTAVLAEALAADVLLLLTDVPGVVRGFGTPRAEPVSIATPAVLRQVGFPPDSMGLKVAAGCRFVERTGRPAAIGALPDAALVLAGHAGTAVVPAAAPDASWCCA
jgi:carbamate kinase